MDERRVIDESRGEGTGKGCLAGLFIAIGVIAVIVIIVVFLIIMNWGTISSYFDLDFFPKQTEVHNQREQRGIQGEEGQGRKASGYRSYDTRYENIGKKTTK